MVDDGCAASVRQELAPMRRAKRAACRLQGCMAWAYEAPADPPAYLTAVPTWKVGDEFLAGSDLVKFRIVAIDEPPSDDLNCSPSRRSSRTKVGLKGPLASRLKKVEEAPGDCGHRPGLLLKPHLCSTGGCAARSGGGGTRLRRRDGGFKPTYPVVCVETHMRRPRVARSSSGRKCRRPGETSGGQFVGGTCRLPAHPVRSNGQEPAHGSRRRRKLRSRRTRVANVPVPAR